MLRYADVPMDLTPHRVSRAGTPVYLGRTEFRLLRYFLQHPRRVFSGEQLLDGRRRGFRPRRTASCLV